MGRLCHIYLNVNLSNHYVRPGDLPRIKAELAAYRQFKALSARLPELSLAESKRKSSLPPQASLGTPPASCK